ncbi:MAG TPA: hypothetical protein VG294_07280 [Solirubrobacteraceae bacterium]|jgi:hypothetical protein|nr:hypothetical protein [Solirubrobacteraceae bacterium]
MPDTVTIDRALDAFLRDQRARLSDRTYRNYEDVIRLLRDSLNSYAYSSLDTRDAKRWQKAFDLGDEEAFCHLFGPDEIPPHLGEFLGYFMVRKVSRRPGAAQGGGDGYRQARTLARAAGVYRV